eukprot:g3009.t1
MWRGVRDRPKSWSCARGAPAGTGTEHHANGSTTCGGRWRGGACGDGSVDGSKSDNECPNCADGGSGAGGADTGNNSGSGWRGGAGGGVPNACYRNLIGAKKPDEAVYKKTRQPTCTAKDLEKAMAELKQMEQMERAVTQCSDSQIDAAVASAAVQMAIQQAAEQLADSTYQEQRGPLMAAMQSRVQEAALMHNAKRAATENQNNQNRLSINDANATIELPGATARAATESQPNPPPAAETYAMEKALEEHKDAESSVQRAADTIEKLKNLQDKWDARETEEKKAEKKKKKKQKAYLNEMETKKKNLQSAVSDSLGKLQGVTYDADADATSSPHSRIEEPTLTTEEMQLVQCMSSRAVDVQCGAKESATPAERAALQHQYGLMMPKSANAVPAPVTVAAAAALTDDAPAEKRARVVPTANKPHAKAPKPRATSISDYTMQAGNESRTYDLTY